VEALFAKNLFTKNESAQIIETLFELIKQSLQNGEVVLLSGFGKFSVKEKDQKRGRNPQAGEPINLPPGKVVTFRRSGVLREKWNFVQLAPVYDYRPPFIATAGSSPGISA
jgi:integration host factor subunit alpha